MPCPYCRSRKVAVSEAIATYDVRDEYITVDRIVCGKCGESYTKMIRENLHTGNRKVICSSNSKRDESPVRRRKRGLLSFFRRQRR